MTSLPAVHSQHESIKKNETMEGCASAEEREGIRTLIIIIGGILCGAIAASVLANLLVAYLS
jgi:hypothetical protein